MNYLTYNVLLRVELLQDYGVLTRQAEIYTKQIQQLLFVIFFCSQEKKVMWGE